MDTEIEHGGDLFAAEREFGRPSGGWLDLSTGVNPRGYPFTALNAATLQQLPQHFALLELLDRARGHYAVPAPLDVVAGAGSQAMIQALARVRAPSRVAVVSPTYGEHAAQWTMAGHEVELVATLDEASSHDVVILSNPNNPDGALYTPGQLLEVMAKPGQAGQLVVVDEAFADTVPEMSLIPHVAATNFPAGSRDVVVLRSFGKFFGLAGVRLGFAIGRPQLLEGVRRSLGPWPVSGPALEIGGRALGDATWIAQTRAWLETMSSRVVHQLRAAGYRIAGATALFSLLEHPYAGAVFAHLAAGGIFTRRFAGQPNWLRVGLPGSDAELERLMAALGSADKHRSVGD